MKQCAGKVGQSGQIQDQIRSMAAQQRSEHLVEPGQRGAVQHAAHGDPDAALGVELR